MHPGCPDEEGTCNMFAVPGEREWVARCPCTGVSQCLLVRKDLQNKAVQFGITF